VRGESWLGGAPCDPAANVESQATVRAVSAPPWERQLILVFRYCSERSLAEAAEDLGVSREHALRLQEDALCQVHDAMLAAASG
jgi:DNA-directed RNA polymerase specialized sigma subunit